MNPSWGERDYKNKVHKSCQFLKYNTDSDKLVYYFVIYMSTWP